MPYVPPHLRSIQKNNLKQNIRRKALVIPIINNKYVVARNSKTGNTTFMGGGCRSGNNIKNCAHRELQEESRQSIQNRNLKNFFTFRVGPEYRSKKELKQNENRKIKVLTDYHVFSLKPTKSFNNIYKNFHNFNPKTNAQKEMSNIMLKSFNNLNKNNKLWKFMRNKVLPKLQDDSSRRYNSRGSRV